MALADQYQTTYQRYQSQQSPTQTSPTQPTQSQTPQYSAPQAGSPANTSGNTGIAGPSQSTSYTPPAGYTGNPKADFLKLVEGQAPTADTLARLFPQFAQWYPGSTFEKGDIKGPWGWADVIGNMDDPTQQAHWQWYTGSGKTGAAGSPTGYTMPSSIGGASGGTAGFRQFNVLDPTRWSALYQQLLNRSNQSLQVDPNDPIIANQVDSYRAEQERGVRNYLDQQAEAQGPYSNLNSERRLANEGAAQATGGLQASLVQNEMMARRQEIQSALTQQGAMLSDQQRLALQQELGMIDANLRQQMINSGNDQFLADLGLRAANQANYWNYNYLMG